MSTGSLPGLVAVAQPVDLLAVAPLLLTALAATAVLVADLFLAPRRRPFALVIALGGVAAAGLCLLPVAGAPRSTFCVAGLGPGGCSYTVDALTVAVQVLVLGGAAIALLLSVGAARDLRLPPGEHAFLLLCATTGALALAGARDLLTLVVALEVSALPAVGLVALRREDRRGGEAGLKLFLVSVVATAVTLFGLSLVYAVTGEVHLARIADALADPAAARTPVAAVGVVTAVAGFAVKVAAVPFHVWAPDTYAGAPLPVAAYLSVVSKAAGVVGLLLLLTVGFPAYAGTWAPVLAVLAAASMTVGNLVALRQRDAVRLLAWSAVAQSGFILVPLGAAVGTGTPAVAPATVAYLLAYGVVTLGAFSVVALVVRRTGSTLLEAQRGLARTDPWLGAALIFALLGLAGLPPGVLGLFAKVVVVAAPVTGGPGWLAVLTAVNIVLALAYYLSWTALLLARPVAAVTPATAPGWARRGEQAAVTLTFGAGVVLSVLPGVVVGALG